MKSKENDYKNWFKNNYTYIAYNKNYFSKINIKSIKDESFYKENNKMLSDTELKFSTKTKREIERSCGSFCANCFSFTFKEEKRNNDDNDTVYTSSGEACHIISSSLNGPRSDKELRLRNPDYIASPQNGIWACLDCHRRLIDKKELEGRFSAEELIKKRNFLTSQLSNIGYYQNLKTNKDNKISKSDFEFFKDKEYFLKSLTFKDILNALSKDFEDFYIEKKGSNININVDSVANDFNLNNFFKPFINGYDYKITEMSIFEHKNGGKHFIFEMGIVLSNKTTFNLINSKSVFFHRMTKKDKNIFLNKNHVVYNIEENDVYMLTLNEGSMIFVSKDGKIVFIKLPNLVNNIMKYNYQKIYISINGVKKYLQLGP